MVSLDDITIGLSILSWRGGETLKHSLESYQNAKLFDLFDASQVFLPDPDETVLNVVRGYNVRMEQAEKNLGILGNLAEAAQRIETDYLLMLENDCPLYETTQTAREQFERSLTIMQDESVVAARFRSVKHPGAPEPFGPEKYSKLYAPGIVNRLHRALRPGKVKRLSGYAAYLGPEAMARHPGYFKNLRDGYILIDNRVGNWTNQSVLVRREQFINEIIPMARAEPSRRGANGMPNLEIELNKSRAWRNSGWKTLLTPGVFTHERIGYRGY